MVSGQTGELIRPALSAAVGALGSVPGIAPTLLPLMAGLPAWDQGVTSTMPVIQAPVHLFQVKNCVGIFCAFFPNPKFVSVDGAWSPWSAPSPCSVTCGGGTQTQTRACDSPVPANGGANCPGSSTQSNTCNTDACPAVPGKADLLECQHFDTSMFSVNGNWGPWGAYSACSVTCGGGTHTRSRSCNDPAPANGGTVCPAPATETATCGTLLCPRELEIWSKYEHHQKIIYFSHLYDLEL